MNEKLLEFLCDPATGRPFRLRADTSDPVRGVLEGALIAEDACEIPILNGIPRFVDSPALQHSVNSFGDEWNRFNFIDHKENWLAHTVKNTFGSAAVFEGRMVVDAGGGSGAQTRWMLDSGAAYVILLELSHSVDDVIRRNLEGVDPARYDIIQCSIDAPPIRKGSINGIVYCHNVIQHTPSVEKTAHALFSLLAPGGEFVFNCYPKNDKGLFRWVRLHMIYTPLRFLLSRSPKWLLLGYCHLMAALRQVPAIGMLLEKLHFCVRGEIVNPRSKLNSLVRSYRTTVLNTYDCYGSHSFQHLKTESELESLLDELQPDRAKILNRDPLLYSRPTPIGMAFRVFK